MCLRWTLLPLKSQVWDYIKRRSFSGLTFSVVYLTSNVTGVAETAVAQRLLWSVWARGKERKYTDRMIRPHGVAKKKNGGSGIELVTCLFVNQ